MCLLVLARASSRYVQIVHTRELVPLTSTQEAQQGFIDLSDDPPECVEALLQYLYEFEYQVTLDDPGTESRFHLSMALIADKYDISALKECAVEKCKHAIHGNCFPDVFADVTAAAYESSVALKELCSFIVKFAIDHSDIGIGKTMHSSFEKVMRSVPDLAVDLSRELHQQLLSARPTKGKKAATRRRTEDFDCPRCKSEVKLAITSDVAKYSCEHCSQQFYGSYWRLNAKPVEDEALSDDDYDMY